MGGSQGTNLKVANDLQAGHASGMMMAQLSSDTELMPHDVFAQTGAGALRFEDDDNGDKYKKFGKALQKLQRSLFQVFN